jgi:hypothetical protein
MIHKMMKIVFILLQCFLINAQNCDNTCTLFGESLSSDGVCDDPTGTGLCLPGTDCDDCTTPFPVWEVVVTSVTGVLALVSICSTMWLLFRKERKPSGIQSQTEAPKQRSTSTPMQRMNIRQSQPVVQQNFRPRAPIQQLTRPAPQVVRQQMVPRQLIQQPVQQPVQQSVVQQPVVQQPVAEQVGQQQPVQRQVRQRQPQLQAQRPPPPRIVTR